MPYERVWPLPPRVNDAIADKQFAAGQDALDRWFVRWLLFLAVPIAVLPSLVLVAGLLAS